MNLGTRSSSAYWLRNTIDRNRSGEPVGIYSVCSAHPRVLHASMRQALEDESMLVIESTSNQVNQFGGYTGHTPAQFVDYLHSIAQRTSLPVERILLGGDHLGPYPWRSEPSKTAMQKACELVRKCVLAGYVKIHLDASMACADDTGPSIPDELVAQRAAELCRTAEDAFATLPKDCPAPLYVIGTEVPVPGGKQAEGHAPETTRVEHMQKTLHSAQNAFFARGLQDAWKRVIGLVVQPGVEFGDATVFDYDRQKARTLTKNLPAAPSLVYEAHSTDYQKASALGQMVEDHFAILKVGPWLTFAYREAIFALSDIERDWVGHRKDVHLSRVREALEEAMLRNPIYWQPYYSQLDPTSQVFARQYSYSDRCRYYWPEASVQKEVDQLLTNLLTAEIPLAMISQYFPQQYEEIRAAGVENNAESLIEARIREVLKVYAAACRADRQ